MNIVGLYYIFLKEISRTRQVVLQAVLSPVITTVLYFVVFGAAIGKDLHPAPGVSYGAFIVPGLIMMSLVMNSMMATSSGLYFPRFIGTIVDYLAAPLSFLEIALGFSLAAVARALLIGVLIYLSALPFVPVPITYPLFTLFFSFFTALTFAFIGCILGVWARDFEQLSFVPTLIITPLSFLGGIFYSPEMLPEFWRRLTLLNPLLYIVDGMRYGFLGISAVSPIWSVCVLLFLFASSIAVLSFMFRTGANLRS